jgi:hypothetical protein
MKSSAPLRMLASMLTATILALMLATQTIAATWSQPTALTSSGRAHAGGVVTLGTSRVIAAYLNNGRVVVRRSTDAGTTWLAPQRLAKNARGPAIAGRGTGVDVVWVKNGRVRYARSTNSGASFRATVALSPESMNLVTFPKVARGPNGIVVVAWTQFGEVHARVSTNSGASFGPPRALGRASFVDGRQLAVAAGKGVAYVAFSSDGLDGERGLSIRRTVNGGSTWAPTFFTWPGNWFAPRVSLTAVGKQAYVAYEADVSGCDYWDAACAKQRWIQYRRTTDRGISWSAARTVTSQLHPGAAYPVISLKGGVIRVAYVQIPSPDDSGRAIYYSQSIDGLSWTPAAQVAVHGEPAGVGQATTSIVVYSDGFEWPRGNVFVAAGSP